MPSRLECGRPSNRGAGVRHAVVGVQIDLLLLHRPPKALDEDVVPPGAFAVHADRDAMAGEHAGEGRARELAALIGVEDLRSSTPGRVGLLPQLKVPSSYGARELQK